MTFARDVSEFKEKSRKRSLAIFRESAQRLAHQANRSRFDGGRMPVATGFLRNSMAGSTSGVPSGPTKGQPGQLYTAPVGQPVEVAILSAQLGGSVWMGWTAMYVPFMEERYGFFRAGSQNWQNIVNEVTIEAKRRIP